MCRSSMDSASKSAEARSGGTGSEGLSEAGGAAAAGLPAEQVQAALAGQTASE